MANTISFDINCGGASLSANTSRTVSITIEDAEKSDVMDLFDIQEFIDHFGEKDVISYIDNNTLSKWAEENGYTKE